VQNRKKVRGNKPNHPIKVHYWQIYGFEQSSFGFRAKDRGKVRGTGQGQSQGRNATFTLFKVRVKNCMEIYYRNLYGRWFCHLSRVCIAWDGGKGGLNPVWGGCVQWQCDVLSV